MKDLIERQAAIDVILADKIDNKSLKVMDALGSGNEAKTLNMTCDRHAELLKSLPSAQPEPIKITIDHVPTKDELERLKHAMRNTPVMLLPSTQPEITPDGTLNVSIDTDIANVGRILLSQAGTQRGGLYYKDEQPEIIRCRDCKYYDEVNQPYPQMYCRKHSIDTSDQDFCSKAERKDDE